MASNLELLRSFFEDKLKYPWVKSPFSLELRYDRSETYPRGGKRDFAAFTYHVKSIIKRVLSESQRCRRHPGLERIEQGVTDQYNTVPAISSPPKRGLLYMLYR